MNHTTLLALLKCDNHLEIPAAHPRVSSSKQPIAKLWGSGFKTLVARQSQLVRFGTRGDKSGTDNTLSLITVQLCCVSGLATASNLT